MNQEDQQDIRKRTIELIALTSPEGAGAAAILLLADRTVGVLEGILGALRAIEDKLGDIHGDMP